MGTGISLFFELGGWPDVNIGLQLILVSLGLIAFMGLIGRLEVLNLQILVVTGLLGGIVGIAFPKVAPIQIAVLLLICALVINYSRNGGHASNEFYSAPFLTAAFPIGVLSIVAGEILFFEILVTAVVLLFILMKINYWFGHELRYSLPFCFLLGCWVFRESNGNIEFLGSDAAFNIGMAFTGVLLVYCGRRNEDENIDPNFR